MKQSATLIAVILWMLLIFVLSAQSTEQTNMLSLNVTEKIMSTEAAMDLDLTDPTNIIVQQNTFLRKTAHFSLFMVLGVLVSFALKVRGAKGNRAYIFAALTCILYAFSDEMHQTFVPGRHAALLDVLIDAAGAMFGIVGFSLLHSLWLNRKMK